MEKSVIKKIITTAVIATAVTTINIAAPKPKYISPNSDGVQDELVIPLHIWDKRCIKSWSLIIMDSKHNIVRTINNKEALPENINAKVFFKQLVAPKDGVEVPDIITIC